MSCFGIFFDLSHDLPAIFEWELNIQQDRQRHITRDHFGRNITAHHHNPFVVLLARIFEQNLCELNIIFDDQDETVASHDAIAIIRNIRWNRYFQLLFYRLHFP